MTALSPRVLLLAALAPVAAAQDGPHIGYAFPAGGRQGTTFEVTVGGQRLRGVSGAVVSGEGIEVALLSYDPPLPQRELNALREELNKLMQKRRSATRTGARSTQSSSAWTAADQQRVNEIQRLIADRNRRREIPAIAELAVLRVTIAPAARPGTRELRLLCAAGPTNPLAFCVGDLPEVVESPDLTAPRGRWSTQRPSPLEETRLSLPGLANGQILPGDVDRYRFAAKKGQQLVAAVDARELIPYLADAVPGWFQAALTLRDADGTELAFVDDYRFHPDPVLIHRIPADGEYVLEVRDALYRGREDFVYRLAVGELPFITSVFPLGGPADRPARVELRGVNLPAGELTLPPAARPGIERLHASRAGRTSNALPFARDTLPDAREQEPNQSEAQAQAVELPCVINGRVDLPGDVDVFRIEGRYGQVLIADVQARRLDSPVDAALRLVDHTGAQVAFSDDRVDAADGRNTHHADPYLKVRLPRSGTYYLHLVDVQRHGGPEFGYRLRLHAPLPDFDLRIAPSGIDARAGGTTAFEVLAIRRDGFDGAIALALEGAPPGFELGGAEVPAGEERVRVTLTVPDLSTAAPIALRIVGSARAGRERVERPAEAADDVMQAFIYRHLVVADALMVSVRGRSGLPIRTHHEKRLGLPAGGTAQLRLPLRARWAHRWVTKNQVRLALDNPPPGIALAKVTVADAGFEITLRTDRKLVRPGTAGNLIFSVSAASAPQGTPQRAGRRRTLGILPAVPYRVAGTKRREQ